MTAIEYIQSLEARVEELEGLLNRDGSQNQEGVSTPPTPPSGQDDQPWSASTLRPSSPNTVKRHSSSLAHPSKLSTLASDEDVIGTMVGTGEHDPSHTSSFRKYRGSFAGLSLLDRVQNLCKHVSATKNSDVESDFIQTFDFASPEKSDSSIPWDAFVMLPSRSTIDRAIDTVVNQACCNMQFLDRETLEHIAQQVYTETETESLHQSRKPLALLYAVLALSRRFEPVSAADTANAQNVKGYVGTSLATCES